MTLCSETLKTISIFTGIILIVLAALLSSRNRKLSILLALLCVPLIAFSLFSSTYKSPVIPGLKISGKELSQDVTLVNGWVQSSIIELERVGYSLNKSCEPPIQSFSVAVRPTSDYANLKYSFHPSMNLKTNKKTNIQVTDSGNMFVTETSDSELTMAPEVSLPLIQKTIHTIHESRHQGILDIVAGDFHIELVTPYPEEINDKKVEVFYTDGNTLWKAGERSDKNPDPSGTSLLLTSNESVAVVIFND